MKQINLIWSAGVLALLTACSGGEKKKAAPESGAAELKAEPVKVMELSFREVTHNVEFTATLQGFEEVHLAPASPGRVEEIYVETGSRVAKGTSLVQMDRTQLHQAEIQLQTLKTDFGRVDTLRKVGSVARQQYDQLKAQLDIAQANVTFLRENTLLKAPFSGVISGKYYEPGEMYSGAPNAMTGKAAILSLVQIDRLKSVVSVSERYFPQIRTGMEVGIKCDIYPDKSFTGKIFRIHPTIDPASRTFNVEITLNNHEALLRPGMFIRTTFDLEKVEAILVPALAVLKMQGSNERYLFIEENGKAKRISVQLGARYDDQVELIADGLKVGDRIIVSGQSRLLDGSNVTVSRD